MAAWRDSPLLFVREVLEAEPDAWQVELLEAVGGGTPKNRYALKASKGPGKSTGLAWCGLWYLFTRPHPKMVATSIDGDNLRDGLWSELVKWLNKSPLLKSVFDVTSEKIFYRGNKDTWFISARTWAKTADKEQMANALAGIHADHVMFLIDEAGGIPDAVVATAEGGLANAGEEGREAKLLIAGNPTHTSGPLWRACGRERQLWWVKEITSDPDDPKRTPRVTKQWAQEQIAKYGAENPWVLINVFGKFPPGQSNTLIGVQEATDATQRELLERDYKDDPVVLGVDVARHGSDRSVIFRRQGLQCFKPQVLRINDTMELASQVALTIDKHSPRAVFVDMATFGAGVVDRLRQLGYRDVVIGVDGGGQAGSKYYNKRAECWHRMAEWMPQASLPSDEELITELSSPTYSFDEHGRIKLEKKVDIKKRLGVSPDKGDALAYTFAAPVARVDLRSELLHASRRKANWDNDPYAEA